MDLEKILLELQEFANMKEEELPDEVLKELLDSLNTRFSPAVVQQSINQTIQNFEDMGFTKQEAAESAQAVKTVLETMLRGDRELTGNVKILIDTILNTVFNIFDEVIKRYHSYAIELPMVIDTEANAIVPLYVHETDAAADLYTLETVTLAPHSYGNKIRTGVKIQLPEGWLAFILPRSSIGAKTPLRLSNSIGLIDSGYRGELGILYDNISDEPYTINAHDRIAQLLVMPSYRFQPKVVKALSDSDRGETGFGDSGK